MKKWKQFAACGCAALMGTMLFAFAGCGGDLQANGPVYEYTVIPTDETYMINTSDSEVVPDAGITIDGKFDEDFYEGRNWFYGHKIYGSEDGTLEMTTYFAPKGIVVAAKVRDSRAAIHSSEQIGTGNQTCFNGYFAFGTAQSQADGVYEIECTAGNRFKISQFVDGSLIVMNFTSDQMPLHAVVRYGDILEGTCYGYDVEYYIPWEIFEIYDGYRPTSVYFNPTMISADMDEYGNSANRTWYNFSQQQLGSLFQWGQPNEGYVFDANGFVSNSLTITEADGGSVTEEWGYDYCITGDTVNLNIAAEEGYTLTSLLVNGVERIGNVVADTYSFTAQGDTTVVPVFTAAEVSNIDVSDVYAWVDYPASEFTLELNNGESDYTLEYDNTKLTIDKAAKTVKALAEGTFEVKVTSGSDSASFNVICSRVSRSGTGKWNSSNYSEKADNIKSRYASDGTDGSTTVFLGDSFFDNTEGNWGNFYTSYANEYDALELGIGGTTTYDWENFLFGGILDGMQPKNLVVNLGTNNLAADGDTVEGLAENLQRLFTLLHNKMPNTNIYYLSIAHRVDTTSYGTRISAVNDLMEQWCEYKDWVTFVDVEDQVSPSDLKDGLHPKDETYTNIYVPALETAGCVVERK